MSNPMQLLQTFALSMIEKNLKVDDNNKEMVAECIDVIKRGDVQKGEQMADNFIKSYGASSREEAVQSARKFLNI